MPVQAPIYDQPFYGYFEKPPDFSRLLRRALGYVGPILVLNPHGPHGGWGGGKNPAFSIMCIKWKSQKKIIENPESYAKSQKKILENPESYATA